MSRKGFSRTGWSKYDDDSRLKSAGRYLKSAITVDCFEIFRHRFEMVLPKIQLGRSFVDRSFQGEEIGSGSGSNWFFAVRKWSRNSSVFFLTVVASLFMGSATNFPMSGWKNLLNGVESLGGIENDVSLEVLGTRGSLFFLPDAVFDILKRTGYINSAMVIKSE